MANAQFYTPAAFAIASLMVSTAGAFLCLAILEYVKARTLRQEATSALACALEHLDSAEAHLARVQAETPEPTPDEDDHERTIQ